MLSHLWTPKEDSKTKPDNMIGNTIVNLIRRYSELIKIGTVIFVVAGIFSVSNLNGSYVAVNVYLLSRWITNYRKCTVSYIEVASRNLAGANIGKEQGVLYTFLEIIFDMRNDSYIYILALIQIIYLLCFYNFLSI